MPRQQRRFARIHLVDVCQTVQMIGPSFLRVERFRCIVIFMAMKQKFIRGDVIYTLLTVCTPENPLIVGLEIIRRELFD